MFSRSFWEPLAERFSPCCSWGLPRRGHDERHGSDDGQWFVLGAVRATLLGVARGFAIWHKDHRLGLRRSAAMLASVGPFGPEKTKDSGDGFRRAREPYDPELPIRRGWGNLLVQPSGGLK
jgi:hypothetical protein